MVQAHRIPLSLWENHKEHIRALYLDQGKKLDEMITCMAEQHGFEATRAQYIRRLASWKMSKYSNKEEWEYVQSLPTDPNLYHIEIYTPPDTCPNYSPELPPVSQVGDPCNVSVLQDSGYGSMGEKMHAPSCETQNSTGEGPSMPNTVVDDDVRTTYSIATNEDPSQIHSFVHEFANDIYGKLGPRIGPSDWPILSRSLPELLKAFAIKMGNSSTAQANRHIMYFVHKQHRNIVNQVRDLLFCPIDDNDTTPRDEKVNMSKMSLQDKMDLWDQALNVDEPEPSSSELFQNVNDLESDTASLFMYSKMVLDSEAYDWLVQSLKTELSLERGGDDPSSIGPPIRQQILAMLPTGNISRRGYSRNYQVIFQLPNWQFDFFLSDRITAMSSSSSLQMAQVSTYIDQTWPLFGKMVFSCLENAFRFPSNTSQSVILADGTELRPISYQSYPLVELVGSAYSIAEIGEELAWLVAAASDPPCSVDRRATCIMPSIKQLGNASPQPWPGSNNPEPLKGLSPDLQDRGFRAGSALGAQGAAVSAPGPMRVEIRLTQDQAYLNERSGSIWNRLLRYLPGPPVIAGYPIARRSRGCPGLELPYDLLERVRTSESGNNSKLQEFSLRLVLAGRVDGVFYWHEPHSCSCSTDVVLGSHGDDIPLDLSEDAMRGGRHVICDCTLYLETGDHEDTLGSNSTPSNSLHSGILSVSSDSVNIRGQNGDSFGLTFFKDLFEHIIQRYLSQSPSDAGSSASNSNSAPSGTHSSSHEGPSRQIRPQKRGYVNGDSEGDGNDLQSRKRPKGPSSSSWEKPRSLACPFWKRDPRQHCECFLKKITNVSYVKQHLSRRHTPTFYCQRCFMIFDNAASHSQHIFGEPCTPRPLARLDGISPEQSLELMKKSKGTVEEQWYVIWEILFPGERRPLSIYVDSGQSADFVLLREFSQREGVSILYDRIRATGRVLRSDVSEQEVRDTLRQALDSLFEYYRMNGDSAPAESSQTESRTMEDSRSQEVMGDNGSMDSGVVPIPHSSHRPHVDDLAIPRVPEETNAATSTRGIGYPDSEAHQGFTDFLHAPALFAMSVLDEGSRTEGETRSHFGQANLDELYNRMFDGEDMAELDTEHWKH
ncbi:hypothetical protein CDV31_009265 [Fusarium ambrosium]|uniref:Clr5 domain-containing protein n=1 Tax=Fusarium ambrosium TaxID=131363 RepID=A0A428TVS1_9HYPO|nr:hypothetical protein CDV31_009265 [Fusarium ambrosium]